MSYFDVCVRSLDEAYKTFASAGYSSQIAEMGPGVCHARVSIIPIPRIDDQLHVFSV